MIRLIAVDIDGTLLDWSRTVTGGTQDGADRCAGRVTSRSRWSPDAVFISRGRSQNCCRYR
jgi:hypothetical protein